MLKIFLERYLIAVTHSSQKTCLACKVKICSVYCVFGPSYNVKRLGARNEPATPKVKGKLDPTEKYRNTMDKASGMPEPN